MEQCLLGEGTASLRALLSLLPILDCSYQCLFRLSLTCEERRIEDGVKREVAVGVIIGELDDTVLTLRLLGDLDSLAEHVSTKSSMPILVFSGPSPDEGFAVAILAGRLVKANNDGGDDVFAEAGTNDGVLNTVFVLQPSKPVCILSDANVCARQITGCDQVCEDDAWVGDQHGAKVVANFGGIMRNSKNSCKDSQRHWVKYDGPRGNLSLLGDTVYNQLESILLLARISENLERQRRGLSRADCRCGHGYRSIESKLGVKKE